MHHYCKLPHRLMLVWLWTLRLRPGSMLTIFILTSQMARMCFSEMYGWVACLVLAPADGPLTARSCPLAEAAFLAGCQHVVKHIRRESQTGLAFGAGVRYSRERQNQKQLCKAFGTLIPRSPRRRGSWAHERPWRMARGKHSNLG